MNIIKNIHKIEELLDEQDLKKLESGAQLHKRHSRIEFKIKDIQPDKITIRTTQGKSPAENYADKKRLIQRTRELFGHFIKDRQIIVHATTPYEPPPPDVVTPDWVRRQILNKHIKLVDLAGKTGIHKSTLSTLVNGQRPMSQPVKAMFYYFFSRS
jgi:hypothetical protein